MRMQVKAIVAGFAMLFAAGIPAAAEAANALTSTTVNFRASPNGAVFGAIPNGTSVTVLARSGNWCQTEWGGRIGWVYCRYLKGAVTAMPMPTYRYGYEYPYPYGLFDYGYRFRDHRYRYRDYRYRYPDWLPRRHDAYRHRDFRASRHAAPRFDGGDAGRRPPASNHIGSGGWDMGGGGTTGGWLPR
jgi:uncharacterized protein YraI